LINAFLVLRALQGVSRSWTAFNFMIFGMIGLCMFQWPITMYLMVRPDSERDDEEVRKRKRLTFRFPLSRLFVCSLNFGTISR
jgi:hypothetical protein